MAPTEHTHTHARAQTHAHTHRHAYWLRNAAVTMTNRQILSLDPSEQTAQHKRPSILARARTTKAVTTSRAPIIGARSASILARAHHTIRAICLENQQKYIRRDKSTPVPRSVFSELQVPHEGLSLCVHECALDPPKPLAPPETHSKRPNPDAAPKPRRGGPPTRRPADAAPLAWRRRPEAGGGEPLDGTRDARGELSTSLPRGVGPAGRWRGRKPTKGGWPPFGPYVPHWP
jgi:hypothetical protein